MAKKKAKVKVPEETIKCTMCGEYKEIINDYYASYSVMFKENNEGRMCICKECVIKLFDTYRARFAIEIVALYEMCRMLDVYFSKKICKVAVTQAKKSDSNIASIYFQKANSMPQWKGKTFEDSDTLDDEDKVINDDTVDSNDLLFWGKGKKSEDYKFLNFELGKWEETHACDNRADLTLLKEICMKILEIRTARELGNEVSKLQKELQDLMKTANVDPAKAKLKTENKKSDCFGMWLRDIEELKPAEWFEDQKKYTDMDGFVPYIKNYVVRPIKNFFTGNKNFMIDGVDLGFKDDEDNKNKNKIKVDDNDE